MSEISMLKLPKWFIIITLIVILNKIHGTINLPLPGWYVIACSLLLYKFIVTKTHNVLKLFFILTLVVAYGMMYTQVNMLLPEWYIILIFVVLYGLISDNQNNKKNIDTKVCTDNVPN